MQKLLLVCQHQFSSLNVYANELVKIIVSTALLPEPQVPTQNAQVNVP